LEYGEKRQDVLFDLMDDLEGLDDLTSDDLKGVDNMVKSDDLERSDDIVKYNDLER
jgi:hypothetical protein